MPQDQYRCLVITELFLPTKGGTAVWFDEVYRRLGGKEVHIVTADVPGADEYDKNHNNTVHRVGLKRYWWLKPESLAMYTKLFIKAASIALRHKIDAVHAGRVLPEGLVGLMVSRLFRKSLVIYAHGEEITTWRQSGKFRAMLFTYRRADKVIANSEFTRNELLNIGVAPENIVLISPGVDVHRFTPELPVDDLRSGIGISTDQKLILSVGRLSRRKGFDMVLRAMRDLLDQGMDIHYALIGIGEDRQYLQSLASELGVAAGVHFLGHVPADDLPRWYNACDLFAMPNREINGDTEGFGMVFLEAAACGKPAIAGMAGGTGSAIEHGTTGLRVDGSDLSAVVEALRTLLGDADYAEKVGATALERARSGFSWEAVAERTRALV